jgi:iron complex transport system ATP-binding protein
MDNENGIRTGTPEDMALNGSLSNFFARKGIIFDQDTGLFRIENEFNKQVRLMGHGQKYAMIRKALSRNGIMASRQADPGVLIEITGAGIVVSSKPGQPPLIVSTIEELLEELAV